MKDDHIECSLKCTDVDDYRWMTFVQSGMVLSIYVHQFLIYVTDLDVRNSTGTRRSSLIVAMQQESNSSQSILMRNVSSIHCN